MLKQFSQLLLIFFGFIALQAQAAETVEFVDLERYSGRWYELASNPQFFTPEDCMCTQQTLTPREDGLIGVYNSCRVASPEGTLRDIEGTAVPLDETNAKLEVDFNLPFKGSYWVIELASDYSWAVVTDENENSLFLLSRTPTVSEELYNHIVELTAQKVAVDRLSRTDQQDCQYPSIR